MIKKKKHHIFKALGVVFLKISVLADLATIVVTMVTLKWCFTQVQTLKTTLITSTIDQMDNNADKLFNMYICISGHFESRARMSDSNCNNENYCTDKYSQNVNTRTGYLQKNANMCNYRKIIAKCVCASREQQLWTPQTIIRATSSFPSSFRGRNNHTRR